MENTDYKKMLESAPALNVPTLEDKFKMLADFGGAVLAGRETTYGFEFVTWDWDFNRKGVNHGHYYQELDAAKQDFAKRSGLVERQCLFSEPQLIEIYRCCEDTLCDTYELYETQRKTIESVKTKITEFMPDVLDRIYEQDRQAFENSQQQTM